MMSTIAGLRFELEKVETKNRSMRRALILAVAWASLVSVVLLFMLVLGWPQRRVTSVQDRAPWACVAELHDGVWLFSPGCGEDTNARRK